VRVVWWEDNVLRWKVHAHRYGHSVSGSRHCNHRNDLELLMIDNIWSRQRKLKDAEKKTLEDLRTAFRCLDVELNDDDWDAAQATAKMIHHMLSSMKEIEQELEPVDWIVESFNDINKRMEKLEDDNG
jgi:hypothetical protein